MLICNFMRVFRNVDDSVQLFRNLGPPFSPKRMNLRGAVRVPLPPSEIDRVGAEVAAMRGGLSRRDVGVALVVAGLGPLTLAFT